MLHQKFCQYFQLDKTGSFENHLEFFKSFVATKSAFKIITRKVETNKKKLLYLIPTL